MQEYNITVYNGDTYKGAAFEIIVNGTPLILTGAQIAMMVRKVRKNNPVISINLGSGITITDAVNGKFRIDEQIFSVDRPGNYLYDIQITLASGVVKTYIKGDFIITGDITHG
jgi:hypothetical protein